MTDVLQTLMNMRQVTSVELRQNMGDVLNEVRFNRKDTVVTSHGRPVAVLVSPEDYLAWQRLKQTAETAIGEDQQKRDALAYDAMP